MNDDLNKDINTLELAKLYESQGYHEDAHKIYSNLAKEQPSEEIDSALKRTSEEGLEAKKSSSKEKMADLLEKWLMLLIVQERFEIFKKVKARLS